jgi:hypothetical protein
MSSTTATAAAPSVSICHNLYDTPVRDAACAMPYADEYVDMMKSCCGDAGIYSYYDDCGIYCAAIGQSVGDLTECLYSKGAKDEHVFCRKSETATATGDGKPVAAASATAIDGGSDDDDNDGDDEEGGDNDSGSGNSDSDNGNDDEDSGDSDNAAPRSGVSLFGVVVGSLLFSTTALGAVLA